MAEQPISLLQVATQYRRYALALGCNYGSLDFEVCLVKFLFKKTYYLQLLTHECLFLIVFLKK